MTVDATKLLKIGQVSTDSTKTSGGAPVDVNMTKNGSIFNCKNPNNNGSSNGIAKAASSGSGGNWLSRLFGATSDCSANDDVNKANTVKTQDTTKTVVAAGSDLQTATGQTIATFNKNSKTIEKLDKKDEKIEKEIKDLSQQRDDLVAEQEASVVDAQASSKETSTQNTSPATNPFASNSTNIDKETGAAGSGSGLLTTNTPAETETSSSNTTTAPIDNSSKITALNGKIENRAASVKSNKTQIKAATTSSKSANLNFQQKASSTKAQATLATQTANETSSTAGKIAIGGQVVTALGATGTAVGAGMIAFGNPAGTPVMAAGGAASAAGGVTTAGAQFSDGKALEAINTVGNTASNAEGNIGKVKAAGGINLASATPKPATPKPAADQGVPPKKTVNDDGIA